MSLPIPGADGLSDGLPACPFCGGPAKTLQYNGTTQATCAGKYTECAGTDVLSPVAMWCRRAAVPAQPAPIQAVILRNIGAEGPAPWSGCNSALQSAPAGQHDESGVVTACRNVIAYLDKNPPMADSLWCVKQLRAALAAYDQTTSGAVSVGEQKGTVINYGTIPANAGEARPDLASLRRLDLIMGCIVEKTVGELVRFADVERLLNQTKEPK